MPSYSYLAVIAVSQAELTNKLQLAHYPHSTSLNIKLTWYTKVERKGLHSTRDQFGQTQVKNQQNNTTLAKCDEYNKL